jgi:CO/xanthine dehydrogenase Mo-binding subunit
MAKPRRIDGIGAPVKRREDFRLLTGQGRYAEDWNAPDQARIRPMRPSSARRTLTPT